MVTVEAMTKSQQVAASLEAADSGIFASTVDAFALVIGQTASLLISNVADRTDALFTHPGVRRAIVREVFVPAMAVT